MQSKEEKNQRKGKNRKTGVKKWYNGQAEVVLLFVEMRNHLKPVSGMRRKIMWSRNLTV